jgi:hypothetical protein
MRELTIRISPVLAAIPFQDCSVESVRTAQPVFMGKRSVVGSHMGGVVRAKFHPNLRLSASSLYPSPLFWPSQVLAPVLDGHRLVPDLQR